MRERGWGVPFPTRGHTVVLYYPLCSNSHEHDPTPRILTLATRSMAGLRVSRCRRAGGLRVRGGGVASSRLRPYPGRGGRSRMGIAPLGMFPLRKTERGSIKGTVS